MQYVEFKITNTKLMQMGGGDPVKQMEERTAYLDKIRADAEARDKAGSYEYKSDWNPFPAWVREIIKGLAIRRSSKARFDDENNVYKVRIGGGRDEYDEFYNEFELLFNTERNAKPENLEWSNENIVHITATADDEVAAMNDLETHQRNAALPVSRKTTPAEAE